MMTALALILGGLTLLGFAAWRLVRRSYQRGFMDGRRWQARVNNQTIGELNEQYDAGYEAGFRWGRKFQSAHTKRATP